LPYTTLFRSRRTSGVPPTRSARLSGTSAPRRPGSGVVRAPLIGERLLAARELEVVLGRERAGLADAHQDAVVRLHHVGHEILHLLAVHPYLEHQPLTGDVVAELRLGELDAPDVEELAQLDRVGLDRLHVNRAARVVGVER